MLNRRIELDSQGIQNYLDKIIYELCDLTSYWLVEDSLIGRGDLAIFAWEPKDCV